MMTIDKILNIACNLFGVSPEDVKGKSRVEEIIMVRHLVKAVCYELKFKPTEIAKEIGGDRTSVNNSHKIIFKFGQFSEQSKMLWDAVQDYKEPIVPEVVPGVIPEPVVKKEYNEDGIIRVTKEEYDERFYGHPEKINPRTGNNWFPAFHYLWHLGAPMSPFLVSWYKEYGHEADRIMKHKEQLGSFVHDRIEAMGKYQVSTTAEMIENFCKKPEDILFVKRCLDGFLNFMSEEDAVIVSSEKMILADDWGGTMDMELRIKKDGFKSVWCVDLKTSKSVFEEHLIQVESYRRVCGADKAGVLILGNQTKKRYTFTAVLEKDKDYYQDRFIATKEQAYIIMIKRGTIAPTVEEFPEEFKLKPENYEIGNRIAGAVPVQEDSNG